MYTCQNEETSVEPEFNSIPEIHAKTNSNKMLESYVII